VQDAVAALRRNDLSEFGKLMYQSHVSLKNDFEVSCPELDAIVDIAAEAEGVYGARMTGAGFGGSAVCLVETTCTSALVKRLEREYPAKASLPSLVLHCQTDDGVRTSRY
jgi:galactokinase